MHVPKWIESVMKEALVPAGELKAWYFERVQEETIRAPNLPFYALGPDRTVPDSCGT